MRKVFYALFMASVALVGAPTATQASALPGQCLYTRWAGFCDGAAWADGSFQHCENVGVGAFGYRNCFQACNDPIANRAVPTDIDPATPC